MTGLSRPKVDNILMVLLQQFQFSRHSPSYSTLENIYGTDSQLSLFAVYAWLQSSSYSLHPGPVTISRIEIEMQQKKKKNHSN